MDWEEEKIFVRKSNSKHSKTTKEELDPLTEEYKEKIVIYGFSSENEDDSGLLDLVRSFDLISEITNDEDNQLFTLKYGSSTTDFKPEITLIYNENLDAYILKKNAIHFTNILLYLLMDKCILTTMDLEKIKDRINSNKSPIG